MRSQVDKPKENKNQSAANSITQKKNAEASNFGLADNRPESVAQRMQQNKTHHHTTQLSSKPQSYTPLTPKTRPTNELTVAHQPPIQKSVNNTGLPDQLKSGIENLSGYSMDDVRVKYNSSEPAQLQAHAYAQGNQIHLSPGQEKHLPHEAWHVVQQKQGRVKATKRLKQNIAGNDDIGLEKEADVMGTKSLTPTSQLKEKKSAGVQLKTGIVQSFSDDTNDDRRDAAGAASRVDMRLDHAVSQDTIKGFHKVLIQLSSVSAGLRPKQYLRFTALTESVFHTQGITVEGVNAFLNLRNNLTPGFTNTIGNPGSRFDPQIEVHGDRVGVSDQSNALEMIDNQMRSISRKSYLIKQLNGLDEDSTEEFRTELNADFGMMNDAMEMLKKEGNTPKYDPSHWYDFKGNKVKKVPATYLGGGDALLANIGLNNLRRYSPKTIIRFVNIANHKVVRGRRKASLNTSSIPITVKITVPEATWRHIYQRHTIPCFAWDIQAVNTFWKEDPIKLFSEYQDKIASELLLIIDRQLDIEGEINKAKKQEGSSIEEGGNINESGTDFFFQGSYIFEEMSTDGTFEKDELSIILKSFAPQSTDMAFAVLPSILEAKKPRK